MPSKKIRPEWKFVDQYDIDLYSCGLKKGDTLMLKKDIHVHFRDGTPTGKVHAAGGIWFVLSGSSQDPGVVFLLQPDGKRHTWTDDPSIYEFFEKVEAEGVT